MPTFRWKNTHQDRCHECLQINPAKIEWCVTLRGMSAICCCPCSIKTTDHADAGFQPAQLVSLARFISSLFEPCSWLEPSALAARELLPQPLWSCLQFQKTGKNSTKSKLATTKRLRQQPTVRRERLVAAGGERHEVTQARSKSEGLAT